MTRHDLPILGILAVLGMFIWTRDLRWTSAPADALPILAALPVFWWLRRPWQRKLGVRAPLQPGLALVAAILFLAGVAFDSGMLLAAGWTTVLWSWVTAVFGEPTGGPTRRLLALPLLAFPWLVTEFERIAWWFRLSGAAATERVLTWFNVPVEREGTLLWCNGLGVSVEAACSGVNGLQSILVLGTAVAFLKLGRLPGYWWHLPVLVAAAWLANFLRILSAGLCGAWLEPETAVAWVGPVHDFAGWFSLCVVFVLCHAVFSAAARPLARGATPVARRWPIELLVLAYAFFCCRELVLTWRWTPYDQFGWLAFALWLVPVWWHARRGTAERPQVRLAVGAVVLLTIGAAADINAIRHVALAVAVAVFHPSAGRWVWLAAAGAWMPVAGWVASRLGLAPGEFAVARVILAAMAAGWSLAVAMRQRVEELSDPGLIIAAEPKPAP